MKRIDKASSAPGYNIYCDESCHLENDKQTIMALGAIWCPDYKVAEVSKRIKEIKAKHKVSKDFEIKWTKVSPSKIDFYCDVVDYFFDDDDLHFRVLVVPDKSILDHERFGQTHDLFYYKMYFNMLKAILSPSANYRIYLDIKDTRGQSRTAKLHEVLSNNIYDFSHEIVRKIQLVRSHEIEIMQLTDLLLGAISYVNRNLESSKAKLQIVGRIRERSGYSLKRTTLYREEKLNIFIWIPAESA